MRSAHNGRDAVEHYTPASSKTTRGTQHEDRHTADDRTVGTRRTGRSRGGRGRRARASGPARRGAPLGGGRSRRSSRTATGPVRDPAADRDQAYLEQLSRDLDAAERASARHWDEERAGLDEACRRAVERREQWKDEHLGRLVADLAERSTILRDETVAAVHALTELTKREHALALEWARVLGENVRLVGGGEMKPRRLHDFDVYQDPHSARALAEVRARLHRLIVELGGIDLANLRRLIPAEFDTEGRGTLPSVNAEAPAGASSARRRARPR
jgi:hypothetical protein